MRVRHSSTACALPPCRGRASRASSARPPRTTSSRRSRPGASLAGRPAIGSSGSGAAGSLITEPLTALFCLYRLGGERLLWGVIDFQRLPQAHDIQHVARHLTDVRQDDVASLTTGALLDQHQLRDAGTIDVVNSLQVEDQQLLPRIPGLISPHERPAAGIQVEVAGYGQDRDPVDGPALGADVHDIAPVSGTPHEKTEDRRPTSVIYPIRTQSNRPSPEGRGAARRRHGVLRAKGPTAKTREPEWVGRGWHDRGLRDRPAGST